MDQVFFLIKRHEIYVGEYYKGQIKQVKFKEKDFWEVFDQHDFIEFLEHMDYPMNYNAFKNNKVCILYDTPEKYEMLCQIQHMFLQTTQTKVGQLLPYIQKAYALKCEQEDLWKDKEYVVYEQSYYKIERIAGDVQQPITVMLHLQHEMMLEEIEELDTRICTVTTEDISRLLYEEDTQLIDLTLYYPILSPVNIYKTKEKETGSKKRYLETEFTLGENHLSKGNMKVSKDTVLFSYNKCVNKLFGRQGHQVLHKKAPIQGTYYHCLEQKEDAVWAKKNQLIGVLTRVSTRDEVVQWLEQSGFGGVLSE